MEPRFFTVEGELELGIQQLANEGFNEATVFHRGRDRRLLLIPGHRL